MLTLKELQYVNLWANKTPMPGMEYSIDVLKQLEECYKIYKERYKDKEYNFLFSNSEEINFAMLDKNLCHMLGIDFNNIRGEYFNNYRNEAFGSSEANFNSFDLFELILEHMDKVAELDNDINNPAKAINYYKSSIKCEIFKKFSDFSKFNFLSVDGEQKEDLAPSKNLVVASNEALTPYFSMGIVPSNAPEDNGKYIVYTLFASTDPKSIFEDKDVAIPTQILISNIDKLTKLVATPEEKIQLLTLYSNIINKYKIANKINIYGDYENLLNQLSKEKVKTI